MKSAFKLSLADGVSPPASPQAIAPLLEEEIAIFNQWLQEQGEKPMVPVEEAMVRTYLVQKFRGRLDGKTL